MADFPHTYTKLIHPQVIDELWLKKNDGTYERMPFGDDGIPVSIDWDNIQNKPSVISFGENQAEARAAIGAISASDIPELPTEDRLIPTGGTTGQILKKTATGTEWVQEEETVYSNMLQAVADGKVSTTGELISSLVLNTTIGNRITDLRGKPNGLASLDASGVVPMNELNVSGLEFKGAWNASTNTPALIDGTGVVGNFYKVATAGTFNFGNGEYVFQVGDWVMYAGGTWQRIGVHESVTSVNGQTGNVNISIPDVPVQSVNGKTGNVVLNAVNVGARPSSWVPTWDDVVSKPNIITRRGTIGPAVVGFYKPVSAAQAIPASTITFIENYNGTGFDPYNLQDGSSITIPSWASHVRVTANMVMEKMTTGTDRHCFMGVYHNSTTIGTDISPGTGTISNPTLRVVTGIHPVNGAGIIRVAIWQNNGTPLNAGTSAVASNLTVEFFESFE